MLCVAMHSIGPSHMPMINPSGVSRKPVFSVSELPSPKYLDLGVLFREIVRIEGEVCEREKLAAHLF